jgi:hypothetical protein
MIGQTSTRRGINRTRGVESFSSLIADIDDVALDPVLCPGTLWWSAQPPGVPWEPIGGGTPLRSRQDKPGGGGL